MLQLTIPSVELWDERTQEFVQTKEHTLTLEHSLVSLSKWESKWCKPFLSNKGMTDEESIDYIRCMTLTQNVPPETYSYIQDSQIAEVIKYINAPMTATWFSEEKKNTRNKEVVTSELIYFWMISFNISKDYEKWHLNRLLTLIRVCERKNNPPTKRKSKQSIANKYAAMNAARRKQLNSKG